MILNRDMAFRHL